MGKKFYEMKNLLYSIVALVLLNVFASYYLVRFDLTEDKRYTLTEVTKKVIAQVKEPVIVDVFLTGNFPLEFKRLEKETQQILEEFSLENSFVKFQFIDPLANQENEQNDDVETLINYGMRPLSVTLHERGNQSQTMVFPWAMVSQGEKVSVVPLLKNMMGATTEDKIMVSVENLEYAFTEAISNVVSEREKKIAIIKGQGEAEDLYIADLLLGIREKYQIAPFTLEAAESNPVNALEDLSEFDLAIIVGPTMSFSEKKLEVMDQYIMNGGKTLWFIDQIQSNTDSLRSSGKLVAYAKDQSLGELFFKYGVRLNTSLIKDDIATPIKLATGKQGSESIYQDFVWKYAPFIYPRTEHPIVRNIEGVRFDFVTGIDTLKNNLNKTILLQTSPYSQLVGTPTEVDLSSVLEEVNVDDFQGHGNYNVAVLLEGEFTSLFEHRVLPFPLKNRRNKSVFNKMIVVSDSDVVKNQLDNGAPLELGYDKWVNRLYGNKDFVVNAINYLLDNTGIIQLKNKKVTMALLDKKRVYEEYSYLQIVLIVLPISLVISVGIVYSFFRKRKFIKK